MGRWPTDNGERMRQAAMELFDRDGFGPVTAQRIAERAGVTERTFFRHFATKEEVLFSDGEAILQSIVDTITSVESAASPRKVIDTVVERLAEAFEADRSSHRVRVSVIASDPALSERDLLKQEQWAKAISGLLVNRGQPAMQAMVLAAAATATFRAAYQGWATDDSSTGLATRATLALDRLGADLS